MKEKIKKNTSGEQGNYSKSNYIAYDQRDKHLSCPAQKILGTILEVNEEELQ